MPKRFSIASVIAVLSLALVIVPGLATSTNIPALGAIQQFTLVASDADALDEFGWAVDIDINTVVVGA